MADSQIIQSPVPWADSIRTRLAQLAWQDGVSTFVVDRVPFSFSSGRVLAAALSHIVMGLAEEAGDVVVMEVGGGIGYLSRDCLDVLSVSDPHTYRKTRFVVTDGNPEVVADVQRRGVLNDHDSRVTFAVTDLRDRDAVLGEKPRLVILSNVLDAIPPTVLEQREDGVYACLVETRVSEEAVVYDGSTWPPLRLGSGEIVERLADGLDNISSALGRRIVPHLQKRWSWQPTDMEIVTGSLVNSRKDTILSLCRLLAGLPDDSAIVITDFGYLKSDPSGPDELVTEYGLCAFWPVAFLEIVALAQASGYEVMLSPGKEGETHTLLMYKGERIARMQDAFTDGFKGMDAEHAARILDGVKDAPMSEVQAAVKRIEETIDEAEATMYGNLSCITHLLAAKGDTSGAESYARDCIARYPEAAAPEVVLLGSLAALRGEIGEAEGFFGRAIDGAPGFTKGYIGLGEVYRKQQKWPQYFETMKKLMAHTDCDVVDVMRRIAGTLKDTELSDEAEAAERWLEQMGETSG